MTHVMLFSPDSDLLDGNRDVLAVDIPVFFNVALRVAEGLGKHRARDLLTVGIQDGF